MIELPLFALPIVACPRELVPLHIFEQRYRAMMNYCLDEKIAGRPAELVIMGAQDGKMANVGCIVKVVKVIKTYEDGRMDIVALGQRRARLSRLLPESDFPLAVFEPYEDVKTDWNEDLANQAFNLHRALIQVITGQPPDDHLYDGVPDLSYLMASNISLDHPVKQQLLDSQSEDERMERLVENMGNLMRLVESVQIAARSIQGYWELKKLVDGVK